MPGGRYCVLTALPPASTTNKTPSTSSGDSAQSTGTAWVGRNGKIRLYHEPQGGKVNRTAGKTRGKPRPAGVEKSSLVALWASYAMVPADHRDREAIATISHRRTRASGAAHPQAFRVRRVRSGADLQDLCIRRPWNPSACQRLPVPEIQQSDQGVHPQQLTSNRRLPGWADQKPTIRLVCPRESCGLFPSVVSVNRARPG